MRMGGGVMIDMIVVIIMIVMAIVWTAAIPTIITDGLSSHCLVIPSRSNSVTGDFIFLKGVFIDGVFMIM